MNKSETQKYVNTLNDEIRKLKIKNKAHESCIDNLHETLNLMTKKRKEQNEKVEMLEVSCDGYEKIIAAYKISENDLKAEIEQLKCENDAFASRIDDLKDYVLQRDEEILRKTVEISKLESTVEVLSDMLHRKE